MKKHIALLLLACAMLALFSCNNDAYVQSTDATDGTISASATTIATLTAELTDVSYPDTAVTTVATSLSLPDETSAITASEATLSENDIQDIELKITPISALNTAEYPFDSAKGEEKYSSLEVNFRESYTMGPAELKNIKAYYPRIKKINPDSYILTFHNGKYGGSIYCMLSDDAVNWSIIRGVFAQHTITVNGKTDNLKYMTPDACVLSDGRIVCVTSYRAEHTYMDSIGDNGLAIKISEDGGLTWSNEQKVYVGVNWEPYITEAANGEIYIFFTSTAPSLYALKQNGIDDKNLRSSGIAMIRSADGGKTWTPSVTGEPYLAQYVMRQYACTMEGVDRYTDQMPAGLELHNGTFILGAESHNAEKGTYKFSISYNNDNFANELSMTETGPKDRRTNIFNLAGPYFAQFDSGEVMLTYHWAKNFYCRLADSAAKSFLPARKLIEQTGMWGSVELISSHSAAAVIGTEDYKLKIARVYLNHTINAEKLTSALSADTSLWSNSTDAVFCGSDSQAQVSLRATHDDSYVYLLCERLDEVVTDKDRLRLVLQNISKGAYDLMLCAENTELSQIQVLTTGKSEIADAQSLGIKYTVKNVEASEKTESGVIYEVAIPKSLLPNSDLQRVYIELVNNDGAESITDTLYNSSIKSPDTWVRIKLK